MGYFCICCLEQLTKDNAKYGDACEVCSNIPSLQFDNQVMLNVTYIYQDVHRLPTSLLPGNAFKLAKGAISGYLASANQGRAVVRAVLPKIGRVVAQVFGWKHTKYLLVRYEHIEGRVRSSWDRLLEY